ncbi:hypothetical protein CSUI_006586 [Cystoisospora suis]|uniref:Uncharacterized protein n=1 Tax=Cystoisospora suis TaxID=483139 RepID=A0A2C6KPW1_9APIC|nr:hypothetical protein CSUI_006586 [Cystoisospora suis]
MSGSFPFSFPERNTRESTEKPARVSHFILVKFDRAASLPEKELLFWKQRCTIFIFLFFFTSFFVFSSSFRSLRNFCRST